jgi:hypothetical protein
MAGKTPFYKLAFFDFSDRLDFGINVQKEIDRFTSIDRQLYGLYSVFGNGTISGWDVFDNGFNETKGISVGITNGMGIIDSVASETSSAVSLDSLTPSSTFNIYAIKEGSTVTNRKVSFVTRASAPNSTAILIATVVTSENGITSIDNSVREMVDFEASITSEIDSHKHRGTPSKIDLIKDTKNELPGAKLEDFDMSKITSGRFDSTRMPIINHKNLTNIGVLTHAQLDTLAAELDLDQDDLFNDGLLGEIASLNLMQQTLFLKYTYSSVDQFFFNEISIIPGVNSGLIDEANSTVFVNDSNQCIVGLPTNTNTTYFFTDNFSLNDKANRIILTANQSIPAGSQIIWGVNTTNSVDFDDYDVIDIDKVNIVNAVEENLRVGAKLIHNSSINPFDPYDASFEDIIDFNFINESVAAVDVHFRVRWYNDAGTTDLFYTAFSQNDQNNWLINDVDPILDCGYTVNPSQSVIVSYYPDLSVFVPFKVYYVIIDVWDGTTFTNEESGFTFLTTQGSGFCNQYGYLPQIKNLAFMFEMENNSKMQLNI